MHGSGAWVPAFLQFLTVPTSTTDESIRVYTGNSTGNAKVSKTQNGLDPPGSAELPLTSRTTPDLDRQELPLPADARQLKLERQRTSTIARTEEDCQLGDGTTRPDSGCPRTLWGLYPVSGTQGRFL